MKFIKAFLLLSIIAVILSKKFVPSNANLVIDRRGPEIAQLDHIVRTSPTLTTTHNYGYPSPTQNVNTVSFSNNNDNNGYNLGTYGKTAIIASNIINLPRSWDICA